MYGVIMTVI